MLLERGAPRDEIQSALRERGIVTSVHFTAVHLHSFYAQRFGLRRGMFPIPGPGTNRRSLAYTGNLVDGLLRAEVADAAPGGAYWVADAEPYELREVIQGVRDALRAEGFTVSQRQPHLPASVGKAAAAADAFLQGRGRYVQALHVLGEIKDTIACDISKARADLGYEPKTGLVAGMRASVRWCVERGERI